MWQDLQKFSTFSTSLQHLWNKLTTECHVKAPFSLFLTVICSQGIDSRLWTESGWQSLAILLGSEHCFGLLPEVFCSFISHFFFLYFQGQIIFSQVKSSDQKYGRWLRLILLLSSNEKSCPFIIIEHLYYPKIYNPFHIWMVSFWYFA